MYSKIEKIASAVRNDVVGGLRGFHTNMSMSMEQLCDEVVEERLQVLKEYSLKGALPLRDLYISINCIPVDCKDLERCSCKAVDDCATITAHFEIPLILNDYGSKSIGYIGPNDRLNSFIYYTSSTASKYHKYRKRGKKKPYIWIDTTPNENGMYDCFLFNAPLVNLISISAVFKDLRLLSNYSCCTELNDDNMSFIDIEVKKRLIEKKLRYYRATAPALLPNDQTYTAG